MVDQKRSHHVCLQPFQNLVYLRKHVLTLCASLAIFHVSAIMVCDDLPCYALHDNRGISFCEPVTKDGDDFVLRLLTKWQLSVAVAEQL